jgi:hypothetical protein
MEELFILAKFQRVRSIVLGIYSRLMVRQSSMVLVEFGRGYLPNGGQKAEP